MTKTDAKEILNSLERQYYDVGKEVEKLATQKEELREQILKCLDKLFGETNSGEFVADSGMILAKVIATTTKYNEHTLEEALPRDKWLAITREIRTMDEFKLTEAMKTGKVTIKDLKVGAETKTQVRLLHKAPRKNGNGSGHSCV